MHDFFLCMFERETLYIRSNVKLVCSNVERITLERTYYVRTYYVLVLHVRTSMYMMYHIRT